MFAYFPRSSFNSKCSVNFPCSIFHAREHGYFGYHATTPGVTRRVRLARGRARSEDVLPKLSSQWRIPTTIGTFLTLASSYMHIAYLVNRDILPVEALIHQVAVVTRLLAEVPTHHLAATQEDPLQPQGSAYHQGLTKQVSRI